MLPKRHRLKKVEFKSLSLTRKRFRFGTIGLGSTGPPRFSVVVSKKIAGRAVDRNRLRRRIYALIRNIRPFPSVSAVVVFPDKRALGAARDELKESIQSALNEWGTIAR